MPFIKKIEVENGILGLWKLNETAGVLAQQFYFSENETAEFARFGFEKRKKEYLATRLLLQNLLGAKARIFYEKNGKPIIPDSNYRLSISHSAEFVIIYISNDNIGIDIENTERQIDKVAKKFLHPDELSWIEKTENPRYLKILFWCAKEAIYKCAGETGIQFNTQISIDPFEFEKTDKFSGQLTTQNEKRHFELHYFNFENNVAVYCVDVTK